MRTRSASSPAPGASSHDRILEAARRLFASRGYESTSTVAIARLAGTSESQLMKHFGSKEGLLEAIFDQAWQRINASARRIVDDRIASMDKLNALTALMLKMLEQEPDLKALMLLEGRRIRKEGHMVALTQGFRDFIALFDGVLRRMRADGELRRDLHPEAVRSALMGAYEGLMRDQLLARRAGFPARYRAPDVRRLFEAFWSGLLVRRSKSRR
jgi:TetR/AcrR family fatty acid metabolism transcriptional regulator